MFQTTLLCITGVALCTGPVLGQLNNDPCVSGEHMELNDDRRSTGYTMQATDRGLCDLALANGWYRFTNPAGSGKMPEHCIPRFKCGTHIPIWMNGSHPSQADGIVTRSACANYGSDASCCDHHANIAVKNCGNFFVYFLSPTPVCSMAYCVEEK